MSDETEDWYLPWEESEIRPRDPADFAQDKGDCCWDVARGIGVIPRSRRVGLNDVEMPPARFRLCAFHGEILLQSDSQAEFHLFKRG